MTASSLRSSVAVRPSRSSYCGSNARRRTLPPRPWHSSAMSRPPACPGGTRLVRGGGVTRRDEHVAGVRDVAAAVAQPPDARVGKRDREPAVPLLHEHARRHDDEHEAAAPQRVRGRGDGDVGLARAGDGFDHTAAAAAQPAHERVELPAVELAVGRDRFREQGSETRTGTHGTTTVPVGRSGPGRSRAISPRPTGPGTVNAPRPGGMSAGSRTG